MAIEEIIMSIILLSGESKSLAMEAIQHARQGDAGQADAQLREANAILAKAHSVQTSLIQAEARGEKTEVSLLMVHAQDHLMTAITIRDLAVEMVEMYLRLSSLQGELSEDRPSKVV